jgi:glycerophosphoryl diester phosphodiesterase
VKLRILVLAVLLAAFVPNEAGATQPPAGRFVDDDGLRAEGFAEALAARSVVSGCATDRFCPASSLSRAQMASFLTRALRLPAAGGDHFTDDEGSVHEDAINRLADAGIVAGTTATTYGPTQSVTRGQIASMLVNAFDLPPTSSDRFTDDEGSVHEANINAGRVGFVLEPCETSPSSYCPDAPLTRGDMAIFTAKAMGLTPTPPIRAGRLADLPEPIVFGHRGGASLNPENTSEGFRAVVSSGARALELDVYLLADGSLGVMHDPTVDRTTTSSGATASFDASSFRQLVIEIESRFADRYGGQTLHPPLLPDVLREQGNRITLLIEAKNDGSGAAITRALTAAGIHPDAAMVTSSDLGELAAPRQAGYHTSAKGDAFSPTTLRNAGIDWVTVTPAASESYIRSLLAAGLRVAVRDMNDRAVRDRFLAFGIDAVISDDPLLMAR